MVLNKNIILMIALALFLIPTISAANYLWVPKFDSSSTCTEATLSEGSGFGGTANWTNNVMVTDEFSQVFLGVAKANNQSRMEQGFNTLGNITSMNYRPLPEWKVTRVGNTINTTIVANNDTASDGDARLILGLAIAANNTNFDSGNRTLWRNTAISWCKAFVSYDFIYNATGFNSSVSSAKLKWFPASGAVSVESGLTSGTFMHGGYTGDLVQALIACHALNSTAQVFNQTTATYQAVAQNITDSYLAAVRFDGVNLSFIGDAYTWRNSTGGTILKVNELINATCTANCDPMDYDDAPRVASICQAQYYANFTFGASATPLGANLTAYCNLWQNTTKNYGITNISYVVQYNQNGSASGTQQEGFFENGIGGRLNFWQNFTDPTIRLNKITEKVDTANNRLYGDNCFGVFRQSQGVQFWGDAIGVSNAVFGGTYLNGVVSASANGFSSQNRSTNFNTLVGYWFNKTSAQQNVTQILSDGDTTPPSRITNLAVIYFNTTYITWNWTNPTDSDFNGTLITIDDVYVGNFSSSIFSYNLTGLSANTTHNISILTMDIYGNINTTAVFNSTTTDSDPIIPPAFEDCDTTTRIGFNLILIMTALISLSICVGHVRAEDGFADISVGGFFLLSVGVLLSISFFIVAAQNLGAGCG